MLSGGCLSSASGRPFTTQKFIGQYSIAVNRANAHRSPLREISYPMANERDWYLLRVRTAGLPGTVNLGQEYDRANACRTCGAGAQPVPPLIADLPRMGKKAIDCTAHDGRLITTRRFADALRATESTGYVERPVRSRGSQQPDVRFVWLDVTSEWPPVAPGSQFAREDICIRCGRAGHFDLPGPRTRLVYRQIPGTACDLNVTWEYFGVWRTAAMTVAKRLPVGGARYIILSLRARDVFTAHAGRLVNFEPIEFDGG